MKTEIKNKLIEAVMNYDGVFLWGTGTPLKPSDAQYDTKTGNWTKRLREGLQIEALLCDLYLKEHGLEWGKHEWSHYGHKNFYYTCLNHSHSTPKEVMKWAEYNGWFDDKFLGLSERDKDKIIEVINSL